MRGPDLTDALYEYIVTVGTRETRVQRELRAETRKLPMAKDGSVKNRGQSPISSDAKLSEIGL